MGHRSHNCVSNQMGLISSRGDSPGLARPYEGEHIKRLKCKRSSLTNLKDKPTAMLWKEVSSS